MFGGPTAYPKAEDITARVRENGGTKLEPMQLAALLLERTAGQLSDEEAEVLTRPKRCASH